jgi:hypothetical protein
MRIVSDRRKIHGTQAAVLLGPILARHGVERTFPQAPLEIDVRLLASADPEAVLRAMPADLDPGHCAVAPKVAVAVQEALREWVPYAYFSNLSEFQYTSGVVMLGYGASRIFRPRNSRSYSFDVLDSDTRESIESSVERGMETAIRSLYSMLNAVQHRYASKFTLKHKGDIVRRFQQCWHHVSAMLVAERAIVDFYVAAGSAQHDWERRRKNLRRHVKRILNGTEFPVLEAILDMEAACATGNLTLELKISENLAGASPLSPHADSASDCDYRHPLPSSAS